MEGNKYIILFSDYFSRWVEGFAVRDLQTETVAVVLEKFISTHGVPETLISDRGSSFVSKAIQKVYERLKISKHATTSYHPSSDGVVERANGIVINALKHLVSTTDYQWDKYLHLALLAYRTSFHSTIKDTPAHVVYGRDLILPVDILASEPRFSYADNREYSEDLEIRLQQAYKIIRENLEKAAMKQEEYRGRKAVDKNINVGDLVLLHTPAVKPGNSKKFQIMNKGPYRVKQKTSPVNFQILHINNPKDIQLVHVDRLTKIEERIIFPSLYEHENQTGDDSNSNEENNTHQQTNNSIQDTTNCQSLNLPSMPPKLVTYKVTIKKNNTKQLNKTFANKNLNPAKNVMDNQPSNNSENNVSLTPTSEDNSRADINKRRKFSHDRVQKSHDRVKDSNAEKNVNKPLPSINPGASTSRDSSGVVSELGVKRPITRSSNTAIKKGLVTKKGSTNDSPNKLGNKYHSYNLRVRRPLIK